MSRFVLLACLAILAVVNAGSNAYYSSCQISGDPHYYLFDGPIHDFMGNGVFQLIRTATFSVQGLIQSCTPGSRITCLRAVAIQMFDYDEQHPESVQFGWWRALGYDPVVVNGVSTPFAQFKTATLNNKYVVEVSGSRLVLHPPTGREGWRVTLGTYYLNVDVPDSKEFVGITMNGLCGNNDGDASNDFSDWTGKNYWPSSVPQKRYNGAATNEWGSMFNVSATSYYKPMQGVVWPLYNPTTKVLSFSSTVPEAVIPSAEEDTDNAKVPFDDLATMEQAKIACEKLVKSIWDANVQKVALENCMFDYARDKNNMVLAGSSAVAALTAISANPAPDTSSSSSSNGGAIAAAVVCSILAVVGITVAVIYYLRSKRLAEDLTKALVPMNQPFVSNKADENVHVSVGGGI